MTEREKIVEIVLDTEITGIKLRNITGGISTANAIADTLIEAGIGDKSGYCLFISKDGTEIKQLYSCEEVEQIVNERDEYKHRAEVEERALVIIAERVLEYAQKAKVTAMTSGGLFSYDKDAQLALLVNDALLKAEQKMARKENNESDF